MNKQDEQDWIVYLGIEKERRKDLKKYYDRVVVCKTCKESYGVGVQNDDGSCPICIKKLRHGGLQIEKEKR